MRNKTTSLLAGALVAGSLCASHAAVIVFVNQDIPIPATYDGVSVDLETGDTALVLQGAVGADMNFVLGGRGLTNDADQSAAIPTWQPVRSGIGNTDLIENLSVGSFVGPGSVTSTGFGGSENHFGPFVSGEKGYIGFSLVLEDSTLAYGWAEVTLRDDNTEGVIHSWAYDDSGVEIEVGTIPIPEPTQSVLVALGLSISFLRRRR